MALVRKAMQTSCGSRPRSAHGGSGEKGEYVSDDESEDDMETGEQVDRLWRMDTEGIEEEEDDEEEFEKQK